MREPQHERAIEDRKPQENLELYHYSQGRLVTNGLDIGRIHMHTMLIHNVPKILDLCYAK